MVIGSPSSSQSLMEPSPLAQMMPSDWRYWISHTGAVYCSKSVVLNTFNILLIVDLVAQWVSKLRKKKI